MASRTLLKKIAENIHVSSMARLNNRDRVQAALGLLKPEDLEDTVDILLAWDVFKDVDDIELAEALAHYYSTLIKPENLDADDLLCGFDDGEVGSAESWAKLAGDMGVSETVVSEFLVLAESE
jgi:hypothetical protein